MSSIDNAPEETRESRLDHHIRNTKASFSREAFFAQCASANAPKHYSGYEFGFSNPGIRVVRHYIWLAIKLMALYLAKWCNWLFHRR